MGSSPLGAGFSIAAAGFSAYGQVQQAKGVQAGDEARASQLSRAAERGRTAAAQTSAQMSEDLNTTLGNIAAVRAAANIDPTSPTTAAILDRQEYVGDRARNISVENLMAQADENDASARYMREAGAFALSQGKLGAFATMLKAFGGASGSSSFGLPGGGGSGTDPEMMAMVG
jgi:hypothetical protein